MTDLRAAVQIDAILIAEFRRLFPNLETEDLQAFNNTLEGLRKLPEQIAATLRAGIELEALASALGDMIADMASRKARMLDRAERLRALALWAANEGGIKTLREPDFTATVQVGQPKLIVTDEDSVPEDYAIHKRTIDKRAIARALKDGAEVPGVTLGNATPHWTIRRS